MANYPAEEAPIPFDLADYAGKPIEFERPEVQANIDGSLGDRILFENLMAIRLIWDLSKVHAEQHSKPHAGLLRELRLRSEAVVERRRQLGDIPRRDG